MCGGGSYSSDSRDYNDDDYSPAVNSSSGFHYSTHAQQTFTPPPAPRAPAVPPPPPKPQINLSAKDRRLVLDRKTGIVISLDVTGSNRDSVLTCWDKFPTFHNQIETQKYLDDFATSVSAFGDVTCDLHPIQVTEFAVGGAVDANLEGLIREGHGGRGAELEESPEWPAYFYLHNVDMPKKSGPNFYFILTDEMPRDLLSKGELANRFGGSHRDWTASQVFKELAKKYELGVLLTPYHGGGFPSDTEKVLAKWQQVAPGHIYQLNEARSFIDVMLGIIATKTGTRSVERYAEDMAGRQQTPERIENVTHTLVTSIRL